MKVKKFLVTFMLSINFLYVHVTFGNSTTNYFEFESSVIELAPQVSKETFYLFHNQNIVDFLVLNKIIYESIKDIYRSLSLNSIFSKKINEKIILGSGGSLLKMYLPNSNIELATQVNFLLYAKFTSSNFYSSLIYQKDYSLEVNFNLRPFNRSTMFFSSSILFLEKEISVLSFATSIPVSKSFNSLINYDFIQHRIKLGVGFVVNRQFSLKVNSDYYLEENLVGFSFRALYQWQSNRASPQNENKILPVELDEYKYYRHKKWQKKKWKNSIRKLYYPSFAQLIKKGLSVRLALLLLKTQNPCIISLWYRQKIWPKMGKYLCKK